MHRTNLVPHSARGMMLVSVVLGHLLAAGPAPAQEAPGAMRPRDSAAPTSLAFPSAPGTAVGEYRAGAPITPVVAHGLAQPAEQAPPPQPQAAPPKPNRSITLSIGASTTLQ